MRRSALLLSLLLACSTSPPPTSAAPDDPTTTAGAPTAAIDATTGEPEIEVETPTSPRPAADGNHVVSIATGATDWTIELFALPGIPTRLDARSADEATTLAALFGDGSARIYAIADELDEIADISVSNRTGLHLISTPSGPGLLELPIDAPSLAEPAQLSTGAWAYIAAHGDVVVWDGSEVARTSVNALSDGRVLVDDRDRLLVMVDPSDRYLHGILGDSIEPTRWVILDGTTLDEIGSGSAADPAVFEARYPIWADLDGDGAREVIVAESAPGVGARLVVFDEAGNEVAATPPIGTGKRWRHAVGVGPTGPDGATELVEVVTPHLSGTVTSWRLIGAELVRVAAAPGSTTHPIGSRTLDLGQVADVDGDGVAELIAMNLRHNDVRVLGRVGDTWEVEQAFQLPSRVTSNIVVLDGEDGPVILAGLLSRELVVIRGR